MMYALTIRSPVARGRLLEIKAPELPNPYKLITAKQIPGENRLAYFSIPILAETSLSYAGQPVAIIVGPERTILEDIAANTEIITEEEEPSFFDAEAEKHDISISRDIVSGEPDRFFGEGAKIISGSYSTGIQEHWYPEAHGALAMPASHIPGDIKKKEAKEEGVLLVYAPSQWPYHVKKSIAGALGLNSEKVIVQPTCLAAHLDGKIWYPSLIACHAALSACISGFPVKLMLTREEDFLYSPKRNMAKIDIASSIGEKGEILGSSVKIKLDLGAEGIFEDEIIDQTCIGALGASLSRNFRISCEGIRTNIPSQGPMAGFGLSQGLFAAERHISHIADSLGQDPAEWRKQNYSVDKLAIGINLREKAQLAELIDTAAAMSDYQRKWASYELLRTRQREETWKLSSDPVRGIGISTGFQGTGFLYNNEEGNGNCAAELILEKDDSLEIKTSEITSGSMEIYRIMAHDILGLMPEMVSFTNTNEVPDSGAGTLSRNTGSIAMLVERCLRTIKKRRSHEALPITIKRSVKPVKEPGWIPGQKIDPEVFGRPGWGAAVVEVEVNPIILRPRTRGIWLVVDGGRIISLRRAHWALRTGIIQSLDWTCREQVFYENGKISPELYRDYTITSLLEVPPIYVDFIRSDAELPKGIGDIPFCCIPAAYVQAVSQAMDYHFEKIPHNAVDILEAQKLKMTETA